MCVWNFRFYFYQWLSEAKSIKLLCHYRRYKKQLVSRLYGIEFHKKCAVVRHVISTGLIVLINPWNICSCRELYATIYSNKSVINFNYFSYYRTHVLYLSYNA